MGRDYTPYCIIECTFILSDPRYKTLPASASKLYIALWARAFLSRRETLPDWYDTGAMQEDSRLDARTVRKCLPILQQRCLIARSPNGAITVCGARAKGKRIKWKDGEVVEQVSDNKASSKRESKSKTEKKSKTPQPPEGEAHRVPSELAGLELYEADKRLCMNLGGLLPTWEQAYPGVDIRAEIRKAHAWEMANPMKRKTPRGRSRFLNSWMARQQDRPKQKGSGGFQEEWLNIDVDAVLGKKGAADGEHA